MRKVLLLLVGVAACTAATVAATPTADAMTIVSQTIPGQASPFHDCGKGVKCNDVAIRVGSLTKWKNVVATDLQPGEEIFATISGRIWHGAGWHNCDGGQGTTAQFIDASGKVIPPSNGGVRNAGFFFGSDLATGVRVPGTVNDQPISLAIAISDWRYWDNNSSCEINFTSPLPAPVTGSAVLHNTVITARAHPFYDCGTATCSDEIDYAWGKRFANNGVGPVKLLSNLTPGMRIKGVVGGNWWSGNATFCQHGAYGASVTPQWMLVFQFTDDLGRVIAYPHDGLNIWNPSGAVRAKDMMTTAGIIVPAGATQLWGSVPDYTSNNDNSGHCSVAFTSPVLGGSVASSSSAMSQSSSGGNSSATSSVSFPQCMDGFDNDNDGAIDFPNDFSCSSPGDNDETLPRAACQDGIDNDADGLIDFSLDPGCTSLQDNSEFNQNASSSSSSAGNVPQCRDGIDNDADGLIDFFDPGCYTNGIYNPNDTDEFNTFASSAASSQASSILFPQCSDGQDNDGDGLIDTFDPGCYTNGVYNPTDNSEFNVIASSVASSVASSPQASSVASSVQSSAAFSSGTFFISVAKSDGRSTAQPGDVLTYTITLTNSGNIPGTVSVSDTLPAELVLLAATENGQISGQTVSWPSITVQPGQARNLIINAQVRPTTQNGTIIRNTVNVNGQAIAFDETFIQGTTVSQQGCIEILAETFTAAGTPIIPVPTTFTFTLDGQRTAQTDLSGRARFDNVGAGSHTVFAQLPAGWTQLSVTPAFGAVQSTGGTSCVGVVFKFRQTTAALQTSSFAFSQFSQLQTAEDRLCSTLRDRYGNLTSEIKKLKKVSKKKQKKNLIKLLESCKDRGF